MKTFFVDSFTHQRFKGNPAAICLAEIELPEELMQAIAMEIGFSETAFVQRASASTYKIRFFTPKQEIPLCGHASLAAAKVLFEDLSVDTISFINIDGITLNIAKAGSGIRMEFPVYETQKTKPPISMLDALGLKQLVNSRYSEKNKIILLEIDSAEMLKNLKPDFTALVQSHSGINGVLVTAKGNDGTYDFYYRYFWPWAGTNEDPVTGGVQTFLTKYWTEKLNKKKLKAFQSSARTGTMDTELAGDKVFIYGEAVIVFEGTIK